MRIGAHRRRALRRSCRKAAVASNRWTVRAEGFLWNDQRCQKHADRTILYGASNGSRCKDPVLPHAAHGCLPCGDGPRRHYFWRSRMAQTKEKENTVPAARAKQNAKKAAACHVPINFRFIASSCHNSKLLHPFIRIHVHHIFLYDIIYNSPCKQKAGRQISPVTFYLLPARKNGSAVIAEPPCLRLCVLFPG